MSARERNEMRQWLLSRCNRSEAGSDGPASLRTLLDLAVEAYYKNRVPA